jgi:hypothetical protein
MAVVRSYYAGKNDTSKQLLQRGVKTRLKTSIINWYWPMYYNAEACVL